jgi:hypothetical protein
LRHAGLTTNGLVTGRHLRSPLVDELDVFGRPPARSLLNQRDLRRCATTNIPDIAAHEHP